MSCYTSYSFNEIALQVEKNDSFFDKLLRFPRTSLNISLYLKNLIDYCSAYVGKYTVAEKKQVASSDYSQVAIFDSLKAYFKEDKNFGTQHYSFSFYFVELIYHFLLDVIDNEPADLSEVLQKDIKFLKEQIEDILNIIKEKLESNSDFSFRNSISLTSLGSKVLTLPLKININEDDTGSHIAVLGIPQIYAFGETEKDAYEMLEREILSLHEELHDGSTYTDEFQSLSFFLDIVFYEK